MPDALTGCGIAITLDMRQQADDGRQPVVER